TQQESQQESQQETQQEPRINIHYAHTQEPEEPPTEEVVIEEIPTEESLEDRQIDQLELYDPTLELRNYTKPPVELLKDHTRNIIVTKEELLDNKNKIVHTLETFGIRIDSIDVVVGPTITLYEIVPAPGIRISKIKNLEDDIAMALSALGIRIIAPMPGRGTIGIEVPNKQKNVVSMYSVIKSTRFQQSEAALPIALGKTIQDETFVIDLAKMPHLLVAGATGQGKSVGLNAIITSLIYKKHPSELKFVLVDPKKVELTLYAKLENHFLAKIPDADEAIITDNQKVIYTLNSLCIEMEERYQLLKEARVRNFKEYNDKFTHRRLNPEKGHRFLPYLVVIIDEFADLIMTSGREIETPIARIAQLARAVGIHLIIATQRPTTNIITGVIKANFPARIAFRVTSQIDSRTILDQTGANQLVGQGDMLVSANNEVTRVQCAFVDTPEVEMIVDHIADQLGYDSPLELPDYQPDSSESSSREDRGSSSGKRDPLFAEVAHYVVANQSGSASTIQRKFSIGFNRAGRIVDQLEDAGIVGSAQGSKPRQVLITDPMAIEDIIGYD
ncbi:MAG: DNA translocase FtsK, partial [Rikenellaceae bacterium]